MSIRAELEAISGYPVTHYKTEFDGHRTTAQHIAMGLKVVA